MPTEWDEDDDGGGSKSGASGRDAFKEFDCPGCNANNPVDPPFGDRAELMCNYCGMEWKARVSDDGKLVLREL